MTGKRTETADEKVTDNNIHRAKCLERMIMTMNKVILMGRLTKNPEIKYAGKDNDMAVARYMLAVNRRYKLIFLSMSCFHNLERVQSLHRNIFIKECGL